MTQQPKPSDIVGRCILVVALTICSSTVKSETKMAVRRESQRADIVRPAMPDGLYMTADRTPFLLVAGGQWMDPFDWVEHNGIEALNKKYVQGQRFERFHVHTQLGNVEKLTLYSLSTEEMVKSSKIVNNTSFDLKKLAPRIFSEQCKDEGKDLWNCKTDAVIKSYAPIQSRCNTGVNSASCPSGILGPESAIQKVVGQRARRDMLKLDADALHKVIETKFNDIHAGNTIQGLIKTSVFTTQVFYGVNAEPLVSGFLNLELKAKPAWKRKSEHQLEPFGMADLAFVWDVQKKNFIYLQEHSRILSNEAKAICDRGIQRAYCPRAVPEGMWEIGGRTFVVIRHEQHVAFWHYPKDAPMNGVDRKSVRAAQMEVGEVGNEGSPFSFVTRPFLTNF